MVTTEDLTEEGMYCIQHLSPSDADDDDDTTMIIQLETYKGASIYTSWPACPFDLDDVSLIINGVLKCVVTYRMICEPHVNDIIYISITQVS